MNSPINVVASLGLWASAYGWMMPEGSERKLLELAQEIERQHKSTLSDLQTKYSDLEAKYEAKSKSFAEKTEHLISDREAANRLSDFAAVAYREVIKSTEVEIVRLKKENAELDSRAQRYALALGRLRAQTKKVHLARPRSEWSESEGAALWWKFPIIEPPWVGTPLDSDWSEEYTYFSTIIIPAITNN